MNNTGDSLLGTPAGYATPSQIQQMNEYSKYLGQGGAQFPTVTKWPQGVSNIVSALMGGWLSNRANSLQRGSTQYDVHNLPNAPVYSNAPQVGAQPGVGGSNPWTSIDPNYQIPTK